MMSNNNNARENRGAQNYFFADTLEKFMFTIPSPKTECVTFNLSGPISYDIVVPTISQNTS